MVGEKRKASSESGSAKKRQAISFETKVAIIKKLDSGEKMVNVARAYNLNRSTVGTIYKQKDRIMEHVKGAVPMQSTIISKRRGKIIEEMEKLLTIWLEDQQQRRIPLSLMLIQEKAKSIFADVKAKAGESAAEETFSASHGWFSRFKKRANLHHVSVSGEAASADKEAAERFPQVLKEIIEEGGYSAKQVFNVDETDLFWKKMPEKTYISREEKTMPGFKAAKDRLTLMLGANAEVSYKLKPLLVYRAANPRALKNVTKSSLPVIWMSNMKAWVTLAIFEDWFFHHFIPEVKLYCRENGIPFKILLVLDNAPGHPPHLDDFHPDVKVVYLPPNTTSLLQPMDQGVIANFKKYYTRRTYRMALKAVDSDPEMTLRSYWKSYNIFNCVKNIDASWREVTEVNLNAVWRPLCPQFVNDFRGFDQESINKEILSTLVGLSDKLELDLQEEDFEELLESHGEEMSNQDLMELEAQQRVEEEEEEETPVPMKKFETKLLAEGFSLIDKAIALFEQQDPNIERCTKVANQLNDAIQCYRIIYDEKKKKTVQSSLDRFFRPVSSKSSKEDTHQPSSSSPRPSTSSYIEVTEEEVTFEAHSSDDDDPLMI
ncbi:tigger transposable element-derived protein 1-like [Palaemon carinicauda]|uniref:tigger transposable element-derived protein 1-like n=1 Tax=Palaemon carinicauda TaxID=392227 RepID=UPI0035B5EAE0